VVGKNLKSRRKVFTLGVIAFAFTMSLASALSAGGGKFEWTTDSAEAKKMLTELQARIENFQFGSETVALAQKIVVADPEFAMGVYYLSAVTPPPDANTELEKAVKLSKNASEGERRFIQAMQTARANNGANFADAVPLLEALAAEFPEERLVQMILGQIYQGAGNSAKARTAFERALQIGPPSSRARSFLANDDLLEGEYARARETFGAIQRELPDGAAPAPVRYGIAFSYLYEGQDERAIETLNHYLGEYRESGAAESFPEVFIWNSIARIHLENERAEEAMTAYEKGFESVPGSGLPDDQKELWLGRLKHGRCRTLAKLGRHDDAWKEAEEIKAMIDEGGEDAEQYLPVFHYLIGYLKLEAGEPKDAIEHLQQANPNDPFHRLLLARAFDKVGDTENAEKTYREILESTNNGLERALAYPEAKRRLSAKES
jgi:tetratricopeptide (TPR) repeat protein